MKKLLFLHGFYASGRCVPAIVANSCGSFYAQMIASIAGIPALLGNPHFGMSEFLSQRIGQFGNFICSVLMHE